LKGGGKEKGVSNLPEDRPLVSLKKFFNFYLKTVFALLTFLNVFCIRNMNIEKISIHFLIKENFKKYRGEP